MPLLANKHLGVLAQEKMEGPKWVDKSTQNPSATIHRIVGCGPHGTKWG